jgi:hypothetical protein
MTKKRDVQLIDIIDNTTNEVVKTIETTATGSNYDAFLRGLARKVDTDRFYFVERE